MDIRLKHGSETKQQQQKICKLMKFRTERVSVYVPLSLLNRRECLVTGKNNSGTKKRSDRKKNVENLCFDYDEYFPLLLSTKKKPHRNTFEIISFFFSFAQASRKKRQKTQ